jgi:hypothetical protein
MPRGACGDKEIRRAERRSSTVSAPVAPLAATHGPTEKHREPALLAVVQAVVEGLRGRGQLLQVGGAGAEPLGSAGEAINRTDFRVLILIVIAALSLSSEPLGSLLREIAHRRFERSPILFLFGVQFEAGLQRGDARVKEGRAVLRTETTMLFPLGGIVRHGKATADERRQSKRGRQRDHRERCFHGTNLLIVRSETTRTLDQRRVEVQ